MYKAIKDNKIIEISNTNDFPYLVKDEVVEDTEHTVDDYDLYYYEEEKAEYLLKSEIPASTQEEQSKKREQAYKDEVDGITAHIQRLRDKEQTPEIITKIEQLIAERDAKVEEIQQRYPYSTDPITEEE